MKQENEIAKIVVDAAFGIHQQLGPGLLESVYESVLAMELASRGLNVQCQVPCEIKWKGVSVGDGFRMDMLVEEILIVELKSTESNLPVYGKQLLTYLRLSGRRLGLLINFGSAVFKDGVRRVANGI